jgi:hypothetical protein
MAKLSESLRNYYLGTGSIKTALTAFAVSFFDGAIPTIPSDAVTGTKLITFTVGNDGVTGATWGTPVGGILSRTPTEAMSGTCLVGGSPTFYRIHLLAESPSSANTTFFREQGTLGVANTDGILDSSFFPMILGTVYPLGNVVTSTSVGS